MDDEHFASATSEQATKTQSKDVAVSRQQQDIENISQSVSSRMSTNTHDELRTSSASTTDARSEISTDLFVVERLQTSASVSKGIQTCAPLSSNDALMLSPVTTTSSLTASSSSSSSSSSRITDARTTLLNRNGNPSIEAFRSFRLHAREGTSFLSLLPSCLLQTLLTTHLCGSDLYSLSMSHPSLNPAALRAAYTLVQRARHPPPPEYCLTSSWPAALCYLESLTKHTSKTPGRAYVAGRVAFAQLLPAPNAPSDIVAAAVGALHVLLVSDDGSLYAAGVSHNGRLGLDVEDHNNAANLQVENAMNYAACFRKVPLHSRIACVGAGAAHSLALCANGEVYGAGNNSRGQLGFSDARDRPSFTKLKVPKEASRVVCVAAGALHSLLVTEQGQLYAAGENASGQLGLCTRRQTERRFVRVDIIGCSARIIDAVAGEAHSVVLDEHRHVYATGLNCTGQLGVGDRVDRGEFVKVWNASTQGRVVEIAAGGSHSMIRTDRNVLFVAGEAGVVSDAGARRGTGFGKVMVNVQGIAAGWGHCVIRKNGKAFTAGENRAGELAIGDTSPKWAFGQVNAIKNEVLFVSAGGENTVVIVRPDGHDEENEHG